jgi:hypothetical protein
MMKYILGITFLLFFSCGNQEDILLPKANRTIVKEITDLSPTYIFFRVNGKDTLAEVNRKNSIITTNWVLNIDRRLPLGLVIPQVMKLQQRKREEKEHRNELAQNYYSYADSIGKNLAFIPFTNVYYRLEKPKNGIAIFFGKDGQIKINDVLVSKEELIKQINTSNIKSDEIRYCFDKNCSYGSYLQHKVFMDSIAAKTGRVEEFIY